MRYLLALLLPPLAVLFCGKLFQAMINLILCIFLWIPGVIHAVLVVHEYYADKRNDKLIRAMRG